MAPRAARPCIPVLGAAISATIGVVKLVDLRLDATLRSAPTWAEFAAFLANPFVHVRRCLTLERCHNRNMQQFFWRDVFSITGGRRAPVRTTLLVFALSALMYELIFAIAIGRVQGYQAAFFAVQGVAAAATARVDARGWTKIAFVAATLAFMLGSSVLFFASIHALTPFYSRGLPAWLWAR